MIDFLVEAFDMLPGWVRFLIVFLGCLALIAGIIYCCLRHGDESLNELRRAGLSEPEALSELARSSIPKSLLDL